jgi:hypothetical protein
MDCRAGRCHFNYIYIIRSGRRPGVPAPAFSAQNMNGGGNFAGAAFVDAKTWAIADPSWLIIVG